MECNEAQKLISAYLDEELDPVNVANFEQHLAVCKPCHDGYEQVVRLRTQLQLNLTKYTAPSHLRHRIQVDLDAAKVAKKIRKPLPWAWINLGIAAVCAFSLVLTLTLYLTLPNDSQRLNQEIVASHYRSLQANHIADVASSDHHTVKPWFSGKLDYSPPVTDFHEQGFTLLGGRLDYLNQRSVAALVYQHDKHVINLYVWPDTGSPATPTRNFSMQGFHLLQWSDAGMQYRAISDMSALGLSRLRELLTAQSKSE